MIGPGCACLPIVRGENAADDWRVSLNVPRRLNGRRLVEVQKSRCAADGAVSASDSI
jgi:hypothetical protein